MKNFLLLFVILFLSRFAFTQQIGGNYNNYCSKIIEYSNNEFIIIGTTKNNSKAGSDDILIIKINLNNEDIVSETIGDEYTDRGYGITKLSDNNILITGESWKTFNKWGRENAFLLKIDKNFNEIWSYGYYATARDAGMQCKELSDGNLMLVGYSRSYDVAPRSIGDVFVIKTTSKGDTIWHKAINSAGNDFGFDFCELDNGNTLILAESSGFFNSNQADYRFAHDADIMLIELDADGNEVARKYWGGSGHDLASRIIKAPDNSGFYIIGSTQSYGAGNFDMLLLKIDNDYNEIWHKTFGNEDIDYGTSICLSNDNENILIAGTSTIHSTKNPEAKLIYLDLNGNEIWTKEFTINSMTFISDIISTSNNQFAIAGYSGEYFDKYNNFFMKITENGDLVDTILISHYIKLYPNPVVKNNNIYFEIFSTNENNELFYNFSIYDITGKKVFDLNSSISNFEVNTSLFEAGIYFYKFIFSDNSVLTGKFIVTL